MKTAAEIQATKYLLLRGGYKFNYAGVTDKKTDEVTGDRVDAARTEEGVTLGAGIAVHADIFPLDT